MVAPPGRARWRRGVVADADCSRPIVAPPGRARWRRSGSFASRTRNIYRHQTERAGEPLPYTLAELRVVVNEAIAAGTCPYCGWALAETNFSVDHHHPISRDRAF